MSHPSTLDLPEQMTRRSLVAALHTRPDWTLEQLARLLDEGSPYAETLGTISMAELGAGRVRADARARCFDPRVAEGEAFDLLMLALLLRVSPAALGAAEMEREFGGPRWKRQASLRRLVEAGHVIRTGKTSDSRYRVAWEVE